MDALTVAKNAAALLDTKKASNINVLRISNISSLCDYFVLATGTGNTHVHALADELEVKLKEMGVPPVHIEGYRSDSWIVLDFGNVVVHLFTREARDFFDLDRLWADGEKIAIETLPN